MRLLPVVLAMAILLPATVHARDTANCRIGDIEKVYGDVQVIRAGTTVVPVPGEAFCARDRFVTSRNGIAALKFRDGTEITVGKDTEFAIDRWKERRVFANEAVFSLAKGAFRALTGSMTKRRHDFSIQTRVATIGVRGTEFWGGFDLTPDALDVIMLNGKGVYVENEAGRVELTTAGTGTTVSYGKAPKEPNVWGDAKVKRAVQTITP